MRLSTKSWLLGFVSAVLIAVFALACDEAGELDAGSSASGSCRDWLAAGSTSSGVYSIDSDGPGAGAPFDAYCDMTTDGGGWMLTYKVRSNIDSNTNPWWDIVMPGSGTSFPVDISVPTTSTEGPTLAVRAALTADIAATEWRASTRRDGTGVVEFDVASTYTSSTGQAMRCFAAGTCASAEQDCSTAITDGRVLANNLGGPASLAAGGTGFLCDVGWTGCDFCVDWSSVRTDSNAGGSSTDGVSYVGDTAANIPDTTTFYFIR